MVEFIVVAKQNYNQSGDDSFVARFSELF